MTDRTSAHLDEEGVLRWQMGDAAEAERAHLTACAECQAQTKTLGDSLSWFGAAARQWGEEKAAVAQEWSATRNAAAHEWRESKAAAARSWRRMVAAWAIVGTVVLLMFAVGIPRWKAHQSAIEAQVWQRQQQQEKQELARDNALLEEVDQDVSQVVPEAMQPLSWNAVNGSTTGATSGTALRQ
jgi:hypothetical protein